MTLNLKKLKGAVTSFLLSGNKKTIGTGYYIIERKTHILENIR